jgi:hypothetical protein
VFAVLSPEAGGLASTVMGRLSPCLLASAALALGLGVLVALRRLASELAGVPELADEADG